MNGMNTTGFVRAIGAVIVCLTLGSVGIGTASASEAPCGHKDQRACPALRKGPECFDYTQKIKGICRARGGEGERQYKKGLGFIGFDCKPGYQKDPHKKGYCTACGDLNQPSCEAARKGPRCDEGLKAKKVGGWEKCVPDNGIESQLKRRASAEIMKNLQVIVDIALRAINERAQKSDVHAQVARYKKGVDVRSGSGAVQPLELREAAGTSGSDDFKCWTLAGGGDANVVVGISIESGLAFPFRGGGEKGYTQVSTDYQIGFGASVGPSVGVSTGAYDRQGGRSLGYRLSVTSLLNVVKDAKELAEGVRTLKQLAGLHPDLVIGVWFGRARGGQVGGFQGLTASFSGAVGLGIGATYSRAQTWQF
jgi:hypothetical protein